MTKFEELQRQYKLAVEKDDEAAILAVADKIADYQRRKLYAACVRNLKIKGGYNNLFKFASNYANVTVRTELFPESESYEISPLDTKHGWPVTVKF